MAYDGSPASKRAVQAAVDFASDAADDAALLGAAVRRGLEALDETLAPHRAELARRAEQARGALRSERPTLRLVDGSA